MQTFLPYTDILSFHLCGIVLDKRRLGKQRVEVLQILDLCEGRTDNRWRNHVAVRSWKGYENCLRYYGNCIISEFIRRNGNNNMPYWQVPDIQDIEQPPWFNDPRLQLSHRCNLVRKQPSHYLKFGWDKIDVGAPYWWPVPLFDKHKQELMVQYWGK